MTFGDKIRNLTDTTIADYLLTAARTDDGQFLYGLWCDDKGECNGCDDCRDEWHKNCILRFVRREAPGWIHTKTSPSIVASVAKDTPKGK